MIQIVSGDMGMDEVNIFLKDLADSELSKSQHHCDDIRIKPTRIGKFVVIVSFKEHCGFLVDSSFKFGILSNHKEKFIINKH